MAIRLFLVPIVTGTAIHPLTLQEVTLPRAPKYRELYAGAPWGGIDFGFEPVYLLVADVDATMLAALVANADVTAIPANLDNTLGANRQTAEDALESRNLPGDWVTTGMTWRFVVRAVTGVLTFAGRFGVVTGGGRLFPPGVTMTTTYAELSQEIRDKIRQTLDALGYDRGPAGAGGPLTATSTMRDLLRLIGQQAPPWECGIAPGVTVTV